MISFIVVNSRYSSRLELYIYIFMFKLLVKLAQALKKFVFLKRLCISDKALQRVAIQLSVMLKGCEEKCPTPLAQTAGTIEILFEWIQIFESQRDKMNAPLLELERANRAKFGPRSQSVPWSQRKDGLRLSYDSQDPKHIAKFNYEPGDNGLVPISIQDAVNELKLKTAASLPFMQKKGKVIKEVLANFDSLLKRKDPCCLYTRTTEMKKTRNVWGYPIADTIFEMMFYIPLLNFQKQQWNRAALVSPDVTAQRITQLILYAMSHDMVLYSVDFAAFDASIKYQYIIKAFDYIKSLFASDFASYLAYVCERMYTIGIVTPSGIYVGKHGVPSGSTFTNEVDSIVQFGIASLCDFINAKMCQIQGDDGVYVMSKENIEEFEAAFKYAGLKLEKSKSIIAKDHVIFCQNLYHIDYMNDQGYIGGIYPTFRALNRILFQERFIDFKKDGIDGSNYFSIRCITILENCKHHPLHEELVRFVLSKEKYRLDISDDQLTKYCSMLHRDKATVTNLNHQYGTQVEGIKGFKTYELIRKIQAEEELVITDPCDHSSQDSVRECSISAK